MGVIAEAIAEYAQPLIDVTDGSVEQLNRALAISQVCWNLAIMPEESRRAVLDGLRSTLRMDDAEFDDFQRSVVLPMIHRHEEMFPRLHGRQPLEPPHFHWGDLPPMRVSKTCQQQPTAPGRYDPCPCNSGKKFKFCCGQAPR
jgi:hypothetical protein